MLEILKRHPVVAVFAVLTAATALFLAVLVVGVVLISSGRRGIPPVPSPDGQVAICPYLIGTSPIVHFELRGPRNRFLFRDTTDASDVMRWEFRWEDTNSFILDSSDIGTVRWSRNANGDWERAGQSKIPGDESP